MSPLVLMTLCLHVLLAMGLPYRSRTVKQEPRNLYVSTQPKQPSMEVLRREPPQVPLVPRAPPLVPLVPRAPPLVPLVPRIPPLVPRAPPLVPLVPRAPPLVPLVPRAPPLVPLVPRAPPLVPLVPRAPPLVPLVPRAPPLVPLVPRAPPLVPLVPRTPPLVPLVPRAPPLVPLVPRAPPLVPLVLREQDSDDYDDSDCDDLEERLSALETTVKQQQALIKSLSCIGPNCRKNSPIAFYAVMTQSQKNVVFGKKIIFQNAILNSGNGYNPKVGVFTAPVSGTYLFSANVLHPPLKHNLIVSFTLSRGTYKTNANIFFAAGRRWGGGSQTVIVKMDKGQHLWLQNNAKNNLKKGFPSIYGHAFTSFSGVKLD
ncbi:uncharacterized protein LOC127846963 isoform X4 [Dreissena polymorpha]|uniref:uncharacterized protein LOC127846963 isoform X4 n=1 Tax=Dreissena polymorpha TaxID=45954 RepID=UPI0022650D8B|nr:uncharacterized protein LOC127846963 isoform X4 [Dreissena polymorpha]